MYTKTNQEQGEGQATVVGKTSFYIEKRQRLAGKTSK